MALIKTIAELRLNIPRLSSLSNNANLPNLDKAGRLHIIPLIGDTLYNVIDEKHNGNGPLTDDETELLKRLQLPLAAFAIADDLPFMQTNITDNGIRTTETETMKAAHKWEFRELQNALAAYAADGLELLLNYLNANKVKWPAWTESQAYKELSSYLITTGGDFAKQYPLLQPLRTFWALGPLIGEVEENYFAPTLGRDLFTWVKQQDEIMIIAEGGEVDVKRLLKRALVNLTIKHAPDKFSVMFGPIGFTILVAGANDDPGTEGKQAASRADLQRKVDAANRDGQNFLAKAAAYLVGIAAGQYGNDFGNDFTTAFGSSPLKPNPDKKPYTTGNERRRIFVMP